MGRDAFFSTGLERRFAFAVQSSFDMQRFGGVNTSTQESINHEKFLHEWNAEVDLPLILENLKEYIEGSELALPDFAAFEPSLKGTQDLRYWLYKERKYCESLGAEYYTFELGCLIYHQLTYEPNLSVRYEVY